MIDRRRTGSHRRRTTINADYFRTLYDHLYWARDRVIAAAHKLGDEGYAKPNGFTYGSLRGILAHTMSAESFWLTRARGGTPAGIAADDVPSVAALEARWREEEGKIRDFLANLKDEAVAQSLTFRGRDGNERSVPLWQLLTLVYHHTVQHRSEAAEALTIAGVSPGDMDFLVFMNERGKS